MAVTLQASGTQTLTTIAVEYTLTTITASGVYQLWIDPSNLAAGDTIVVQIKTNILTGGTSRYIGPPMYIRGPVAAESAICHTYPIPLDSMVSGNLVFTVTRTSGTSKTLPWKVLSL